MYRWWIISMRWCRYLWYIMSLSCLISRICSDMTHIAGLLFSLRFRFKRAAVMLYGFWCLHRHWLSAASYIPAMLIYRVFRACLTIEHIEDVFASEINAELSTITHFSHSGWFSFCAFHTVYTFIDFSALNMLSAAVAAADSSRDIVSAFLDTLYIAIYFSRAKGDISRCLSCIGKLFPPPSRHYRCTPGRFLLPTHDELFAIWSSSSLCGLNFCFFDFLVIHKLYIYLKASKPTVS